MRKKLAISGIIVILFFAYGAWFASNRTTYGKEKIFDQGGDEYYKGSSSIYYRQYEYLIDLDLIAFVPLVKKIDTADVSTFENIKGNAPFGSPYFKDKNAIYYRGKALDGVDEKSFQVLNYPSGVIDRFTKDINGVYFISDAGVKVVDVVADPKTFDFVLKSNIAKDSKNVYYHDGMKEAGEKILRMIDGADVGSFTDLGCNFHKDKNSVYFYGRRISTADQKTFARGWVGPGNEINETELRTSNSDCYFTDKNNVYSASADNIENGGIISGADPNTFHQVDVDVYADKDHMYKYGKIVQ